MNGAPRCQECGSWNTVLVPAPYGLKVTDAIVKGTGLLGSPLAFVIALFDNMKIIECKNCGKSWHY
jgi:hypothetical protein